MCFANIITRAEQPLSQVAAERLSHYARTAFDPRSDASWRQVDLLWRTALMARDVERGISGAE